jgi:hypothetical protein
VHLEEYHGGFSEKPAAKNGVFAFSV